MTMANASSDFGWKRLFIVNFLGEPKAQIDASASEWPKPVYFSAKPSLAVE